MSSPDENNNNNRPREESMAFWRLDAKENFSDWKLEIVSTEETRTYHVHRVFLSLGPRKSDYFAAAFRDKKTYLSKSVVRVQEEAAKVVPDMLDFIYTGQDDLVTWTNAVELYHLGQIFQIRSLCQKAKACINKSLDDDTLEEFLPRAFRFRDEFPLDLAITRCACCWLDYRNKNLDWASLLDYEIVLDVLKLCTDVIQSRDLFEETTNSEISWYLLTWMKGNRDNLDSEKFLTLVNEDYLSSIEDGFVAFDLLNLEKEVLGTNNETSVLRKRCIHAIVRDYTNMDKERQLILAGMLETSSSLNLLDLMLTDFAGQKSEPETRDFLEGDHHIMVKGISESELNGVYKEGGFHGGAHLYSKHAVYRGKRRKIFIVRNGGTHWNFAFNRNGEEVIEADGLFHIFSFSDEDGEYMTYPPSWGWSRNDSDCLGFPILLFRSGTGDEAEAS